MNAEEFWRGDPQLFVSYRTSFINKKKREMEEWDYKCWLQGAYINYSNENNLGKVNQTIYNGFQGFSKQPNFDKTIFKSYLEKPYLELRKDEENKEQINENNYKKQNETLICQAGLKQAFLDRVKRQREGK